jgi:Invasion associated locus B (IalB) protein
MPYRRLRPLSFVCALTLALPAALTVPVLAQAASPQEIASNGKWRGYTITENGKTNCYMLAEPDKHEGNYTQRGPIYLFITHRPALKTFDEVTIDTGYTYEKNSTVKVTIGSRDFTMVTEGSQAWMESAATDKQMVEAMKRGNDMSVRGASNRGTRTVDTYSLTGFSATYKAVTAACK